MINCMASEAAALGRIHIAIRQDKESGRSGIPVENWINFH